MSEINIESKKISELERKTHLQDSDLFIFQKQSSTDKKNYNISYKQIKEYVVEKIIDILNPGTMAYCDKDDFAKFPHGHNYTDFFAFPTYGPQSRHEGYETMESCFVLGKFDVTKYDQGYKNYKDYEISVCVPNEYNDLSELYEFKKSQQIGEIKLIGVPKFRTYITNVLGQRLMTYPDGTENIDIHNENFKGYVIPNGTTFTCEIDEFQDACEKFSSSKQKTATRFTVPSLQNFPRLNPNVDSSLNSNELMVVPYENILPSHTHEVVSDAENPDKYTLSNLTLTYPGSNAGEKTDMVHIRSKVNGSLPFKIKDILLSCTFTCNVRNSDSTLDVESYPSHIKIPSLIYIGQR